MFPFLCVCFMYLKPNISILSAPFPLLGLEYLVFRFQAMNLQEQLLSVASLYHIKVDIRDPGMHRLLRRYCITGGK